MVEGRFTILKPYGNVDWETQEFSHLAQIRNPQCATERELIEEMRDVHLLIADVDIKVPETVLDGAEKLRGVVCAAAGTDFIDVAAATRRGIVVTSLPDYCAEAVAEHTLALMLCLCRHIIPGAKATLDGKWENRRFYQGIEVEGKTLGIVGLGKIGTRVAEKAKALGMKVVFYSPSLSGESASITGYERKESLIDLIKSADFVSIHTSLRDKTRGMFGEKEFRSMKPTAYFINVARGSIVDEHALYRALREQWIAGAAVDVLSEEPPENSNPLLQPDNIIITPHMAWNTKEAKEKARDQLKRIITGIINNQFPINVVNPEVKARWIHEGD